MLRKRLIPLLLLKNEALVKGKKFNNYRYLGDSMNTIKIFNEKMADELIFIDIEATKSNKLIDLDFVRDVADECYMPFTVGGGIKSIDDIKRILGAGAEKVSINSQSIIDKYFIKEASRFFGSQSIVVSLDVNKDWFGRRKVVGVVIDEKADHNSKYKLKEVLEILDDGKSLPKNKFKPIRVLE